MRVAGLAAAAVAAAIAAAGPLANLPVALGGDGVAPAAALAACALSPAAAALASRRRVACAASLVGLVVAAVAWGAWRRDGADAPPALSLAYVVADGRGVLVRDHASDDAEDGLVASLLGAAPGWDVVRSDAPARRRRSTPPHRPPWTPRRAARRPAGASCARVRVRSAARAV